MQRLILTLLLILPFYVFAQYERPISMTMVEQKPSFPGGEAAMNKWLSNNFVYPKAALEEGVQGRVHVQFVVGKDGSISNVSIVRQHHPALNEEALRVIKSMPKWIPGRNNGEVVNVVYTLPLTFRFLLVVEDDVIEEDANSQQETDLLIVDDDVIEEDMYNEDAVGAVDITEGTNDLNKTLITEQVVAEPVVEEEQPMSIAMVEQKPSFPGAEVAMYQWLSSNIVYPEAASEEGIQGRVVVDFVVGKDGSITDVRVVRQRHPALDKEALRVIKSMPKWIPGRNKGQPVKVTYTLPVTFKLQ